MRLLWYSGLAAYWGRLSPDVLARVDRGTVGGGEAAFLQTAFGLADLGHEVVACHPGLPGHYRGVDFHPTWDFDKIAASERWDAVVSWSDPRPLRSPSVAPHVARLFPQQLNDLAAGVHGIDTIVSPSWSHVEMLKRLWVDHGGKTSDLPVFAVSGSGVTCKYPEAFVWPREPLVGYWSSPDRGLVHLLRVWPEVKRAVPAAKLIVGYEIENWLALIRNCYGRLAPMHGWYRHQGEIVARLLDECSRLDVTTTGALPRKKLAEIQQRCRIFCYPLDNGGDYVEGFCVAALEALAAGCWPVLSPVDALPEVYKGMIGDWIPRGDEPELQRTLIERLLHPPGQSTFKSNFELAAKYTWRAASIQMEAAIVNAWSRHNATIPGAA